jgi:undecaprenyl diphosphate synthase
MTRAQVLEAIGDNQAEKDLLDSIDFDRLPRHVAIIMDGNGRWAKSRFLPRLEGHRAGVESVRSIVETAARLGLEALTVYAFSTENWKRPTDEVSGLMGLLKLYIRRELRTLQQNNIRFGVVGGLDGLPKDVQDELRRGIEETRHLTGLQFSLALNYSGRSELTDVMRRIAGEVKAGALDPASIDESTIEKHLFTAHLPEPDLLIRTSGELRISNFLLWQIAYAEIWVTDVLVARLPPSPPAPGNRRLPEARAPLRRHHRGHGQGVSDLFSSNLFRRILTAVVVLPLVVAAIAVFPQRGPWMLAAILCVFGVSEAHTLLARASLHASHIAFLPGIALFFEMAGTPDTGKAFALTGLPIVAAVGAALVAVRRADQVGPHSIAADAAGALCGLLVGLGAGSFAALAALPPVQDGTARIALLLAVIISSDVCAYFVGRALGRHKLAPKVSPGKTVEGAIGGLAGGAIAAGLIGSYFFADQPIVLIVVLGMLLAVAGIVGDLLESLFKRYVGAKDSGTLFPGHGGALDRMDAFILAAPLLYAFFRNVS